MDPKPPQNLPAPEQGPRILTFEEFSSRKIIEGRNIAFPKYNNFYIYFFPGFAGDLCRSQEHFIRFLAEHPEIYASLCKKIKTIDVSSKSLIPLDRDLYEAYKIMRGYDGVSDKVLFG